MYLISLLSQSIPTSPVTIRGEVVCSAVKGPEIEIIIGIHIIIAVIPAHLRIPCI